MEIVSQFIFGNEISLPLNKVKVGELYFKDHADKIAVYKKTHILDKLVKIVDNYGELYNVKNINIEPEIPNFILLNA